MNNSFWEANFWGIIGTITGGIGLIVSWFSFKYNTPKIEIDMMYLVIPDEIIPQWKGKSEKELKNSFLDYELEIVVRNRRGGAGSIDKPNLLIKVPNGKRFLFFNKWKTITCYPHTEHTESKKESENVTSFWTVRHGRAFNLNGGEKVDEKLEYDVDKADMIYSIVQCLDEIQYFVEYWDNNGKRHIKRIKTLLKESEVDNSLL